MKHIIIILCSLLPLLKVVSNAPIEAQPDVSLSTTENSERLEITAITKAQNAFAIDIFKKANELDAEDENIIMSPLSVAIALNWVSNGAKGNTLKQFEQVMHTTDIERSILNIGYSNYMKKLKKADGNLSFEIANAIIYDSIDLHIKPKFIEDSQKYYDARLIATNFKSSKALTQINDWVEANTNNKIKEIINQIGNDEIMFLLNAIYLKGEWSKPFNIYNTATRCFSFEDGTLHDADFMGLKSKCEIYTNQKLKALNLPIADSFYNMLFILQEDKSQSLKEFANNFSLNDFETISNGLSNQKYHIKIPKFELSYKNNITNDLKAIGLTLPFMSSDADISNIGKGQGRLYLSRVIHKTYLKVDEEGATAAAVTGAGVSLVSYTIPKELYFDRPFLCIIWEKENNSILFISKIVNPTAK